MKRKQTHVRSKSSVTTSALVGAALIASLGAAAAGFASLDTQPSFKIANAGNPTSQPVGSTSSTPPSQPVVITSSTPYSYADLLASGLFNPSATTTTAKTLGSIKTLQAGQLVYLKGNYERLAYLSNKDGVMYLLSNGDPKLIPKWKTYANTKKNVTKTFDKDSEFDVLVKFYKQHKQGVRVLNFIPGNHLFIRSYKQSPQDTKNSMHFTYYGADKKMYTLPTEASGDTIKADILPLITANAPSISTTADFGYAAGKNYYGKDLVDSATNEPCPCFAPGIGGWEALQKIETLPSSDAAVLTTFLADKNQAAATTKYPTLQSLIDSYFNLNKY